MRFFLTFAEMFSCHLDLVQSFNEINFLHIRNSYGHKIAKLYPVFTYLPAL